MSKANNGGNAFPYSALRPDGFATMYADSEGMTLRDYFAAKVMQGLCVDAGKMTLESIEEKIPVAAPVAARVAYAIADAMLAERAK